jgi:hypothetical protein
MSIRKLSKETPEQRLSHARYEYDMAQGCIKELQQQQTQFQWNVLLAAFAVYWRNCQKFLNGDDDQASIKAKNYIDRFKPSSAQHLEDEINYLHYHVLHLSGKRTTDLEKKIALDDALKMMAWLDANMLEFEGRLTEPFKSLWRPSGPVGPEGWNKLTWGPTGAGTPQATNQPYEAGGIVTPGITRTNHTASVGFAPPDEKS